MTADNTVVNLQDKIHTNNSTYETLSLSITDKKNIVGTIVIDNSIFDVTAKVIGGSPDTGGGTNRPAQIFTILCAINTSNGTAVDGEWEYAIPHPFGGLEYTVNVLDSITNQTQHVDVVNYTDHVIITIAQQATQCYDVTFLGYIV
jgi:hypothetical protein